MTIINNPLVIFQDGNPKNRSIVFVHGFPYDHSMWEKTVDHLKENYYCVTYDIRGLGLSDPGDGQYTMESMVDDLFYVIEKSGLEKPVLCGLSLGGYIALRAVERDQSKFSGLILCDTRSTSDPDEGKIKRAMGIKKINDEGVQKFAAEFVPTCFAPESIEKLGEEYISILSKSMNSNPAGVKGCLLAMAGRTDTTSYLSKIKIPSLVLCGEKDKLTPPAVMKEMSEKIPGSKFFEIPGSGHMTPIENPDAVTARIEEFLSSF